MDGIKIQRWECAGRHSVFQQNVRKPNEELCILFRHLHSRPVCEDFERLIMSAMTKVLQWVKACLTFDLDINWLRPGIGDLTVGLCPGAVSKWWLWEKPIDAIYRANIECGKRSVRIDLGYLFLDDFE